MCNRSLTSARPAGCPVKQAAEHQLGILHATAALQHQATVLPPGTIPLSHTLLFPARLESLLSIKDPRTAAAPQVAFQILQLTQRRLQTALEYQQQTLVSKEASSQDPFMAL